MNGRDPNHPCCFPSWTWAKKLELGVLEFKSKQFNMIFRRLNWKVFEKGSRPTHGTLKKQCVRNVQEMGLGLILEALYGIKLREHHFQSSSVKPMDVFKSSFEKLTKLGLFNQVEWPCYKVTFVAIGSLFLTSYSTVPQPKQKKKFKIQRFSINKFLIP